MVVAIGAMVIASGLVAAAAGEMAIASWEMQDAKISVSGPATRSSPSNTIAANDLVVMGLAQLIGFRITMNE